MFTTMPTSEDFRYAMLGPHGLFSVPGHCPLAVVDWRRSALNTRREDSPNDLPRLGTRPAPRDEVSEARRGGF